MYKEKNTSSYSPPLNWDTIDTVLLDMDGTLLDKYFDDYFWEHHVPMTYAEKNHLDGAATKTKLLKKFKSVESSLQWTDLYYWTRRLGLDIPQLKRDISHLISVLPDAISFLRFIRSKGKNLHLVTNAHPITLEIKLEKTGIGTYFDTMITSDEVGEAKEQVSFWHRLENHIQFDKNRTLFVDDTEKVLAAARQYGIVQLIHIAKASSKLPARYSDSFNSIYGFSALFDEKSPKS